ncbi:MAG: ribokinase [Synergistetes bacterium]|nr:ribokinase [Synergistota bacterium]
MNSKKPRVVIVGSFNTDLMSRTPRLPTPGETVLGGPFKMGPGGKGSNQATQAAMLGARVSFIGAVGKDVFGDIAIDNFKKKGIDITHLMIDETIHTGIALIMVDDSKGENMIVVAPGANTHIDKALINGAKNLIVNADVILMQFEIPLEINEYVLDIIREEVKKPIIVLNPAPAFKVSSKMLEGVDVVTPNRSEAEIITDTKIKDTSDLEIAANRLLSMGVKNVVFTLGADGAAIVNRNGMKIVPSFKVNAVDTTGAGDAFNGALGVALGEGFPIVKAVRFANAAAAISVTRIGTAPSMPTREELEAFLRSSS